MNLTDKRARHRAECKARLLELLRAAQANGEHVDLFAMARKLGRSRSGLTILWHELAAEGLIDYPARSRLNNGREKIEAPPDLAARIAAVKAAKLAVWQRERRKCLSEAELAEVLP